MIEYIHDYLDDFFSSIGLEQVYKYIILDYISPNIDDVKQQFNEVIEELQATMSGGKYKDVDLGNGNIIRIRKFDMRDIRDNSLVVMIGKRGRGKTQMILDIMRRKRYIPGGMVFSATERFNGVYSRHVPKSCIYDTYSREAIDRLLIRQTRMHEKQRQSENNGQTSGTLDKRAFLVMDDVNFSKRWINDECVSDIFMNNRHYGLLFLLSMQFSLSITPELRTNLNFVILFAEDIRSNLERIYAQYGHMFPNFNDFQTVMQELTQDFGCLVINNKTNSRNIGDRIFWYKSYINKLPFKMGNTQFRQLDSQTDDS